MWWLQYTLEYYLKLAEQLVDHGIHTLAIKDMAGATAYPMRMQCRFSDTAVMPQAGNLSTGARQ